ncbi:hypothetical protein [Antrihabitans spumae]|uniref:Uncharacterized protein n=1 Tax=Antrihabitans spumae TaxID=3373370 RepID=A0ABW7KJY8_9NOCA
MLNWLGDVGRWLSERLGAPSADAWAAMAGWTTALIALVTVIVAGKYAKRQVEEAKKAVIEAQAARIEQQQQAQTALAEQARLAQETLDHDAREAQKTREEQSQPNVVIFAESNPAIWQALEVVVKNFGTTPAYNIRIEFDTKPQVSPTAEAGSTITDLWLPTEIPILAPWQEWRALWDYAPKRFRHPELADRHEATVKYTDANNQTHTTTGVLDWNVLRGVDRLVINTIHDVAKLIKKQNEVLSSIAGAVARFGNEDTGVWVYSTDAAEERQRRVDATVERRRQRDELRRQLLPRDTASPPIPPTSDQTEESHSTEPPAAQPE